MKPIRIVLLALLSLPSVPAQGNLWVQTDWQGGRGQLAWKDSTMYSQGWSEDCFGESGNLKLRYPGWEPTGELQGVSLVRRLVQAQDGSIYAAALEGSFFRSTDAGDTWVKVGSLPDGRYLSDMIQASDHSFYAVYDRVYKSFDGCSTWFPTSQLPMTVDWLYCVLEAQGTMYVGGHSERLWHEGQVFKSTDKGLTWDTTAWPPQGCLTIRSLLHGVDGAIYAAGSEGGCILRTTNHGMSWGLGHLAAGFVPDLAQSHDSTMYAGTDTDLKGHVWRSTDMAQTWQDVASFPLLCQTACILAASDGSIYAGGSADWNCVAGIYRSTDHGRKWTQTGQSWDTLGCLRHFLETSDGDILAGGWDGEKACVYRLTKPYGWVTSSVFDAGEMPEYGTIGWSFTTQGDSPVVKVRTDTLLDMSTAPDWDLCPPATNGEDVSFLSSVHDGQRYIQYRIEMRGWGNFSTPVFHDINIEYTPTGITEDWRRAASSFPSLIPAPTVFRKQVTLSVSVPESGHVEVRIFDIAGRPVITLLDEPVSSGGHSVVWNADDDSGRLISAGVYFCTLRYRPAVDSKGCFLTRAIVYLGR